MEAKRYHPLSILQDTIFFIRNSFFVILILFVFQSGSDRTWVIYGRYIFFVVAIGIIVAFFISWLTYKYRLDETSFHLYKGVFNRTKQTIPFSKIQNISRKRSLFHRIFGVTSIHFETAISGDDHSVVFQVISQAEADRLQSIVENYEEEPEYPVEKEEIHEGQEEQQVDEGASHRVVHFTPTTFDLLKASFTSLSFLLLIPVIFTLYSNVGDLFEVEERAEGFISSLMSSWVFILFAAIAFIVLSIVFGIVRTFITYGKYEISSDEERIYIRKGVIEESSFSITKEKVQAVEITQTLLKRILGLAEVRLTNAGSSRTSEKEVNSLYPFLPVKRAYSMVSELLPTYEIVEDMENLPRKSLWVRLLTPSLLWIIGSVVFYFVSPLYLNGIIPWWAASVVLLLVILLFRYLDYVNTRYFLNGPFIQFKSGSFNTSLFISKREKLIEFSLTRGLLQRKFGLVSIGTVNRSKPPYHNGIKDIPEGLGTTLYHWYRDRSEDIEIK
ncbi:membrane protein [Pontibacillus halophilus JSM 076056 = DSM 19796]|uniref:Membrane protein n=1 Tax=Pontibacillus halophilus JSM 076056 = DSM 19796 TaxID=1385510 RepID=A0A0A5GLT9_9BACI|nr:PH domain-containing protein [Pontibacillus halophilus]KGX92120.1 membrane protein [Pontibacillus halophilus JSM 076056 = DSM 19796]